MLLRSVFLRSLRDYRTPILGWGIGMGLTMVSTMVTLSSLVTTPRARAGLVSLAASFSWNAEVVAVDTVGGYATWKVGIFIFLIAVWPILAASRMLRGEEERGGLDVLLSQPRSRVLVAVEKVSAMWAALGAMGLIIGVLVFVGGAKSGGGFGLADALLFGLDIALFCAVMGGVALLVSQFTQERGPAAGLAAGLLMVFIVVDMVHRVASNTEWISRLSPVYYYNLSKPLVPVRGASTWGLLVLLVLALLPTAAAIRLFASRDIGGTVRLPPWLRLPEARPSQVLPAGDWSLHSVYARSLGMIAIPTAWWSLGIAAFAGWMVVAIQQLESKLAGVLAASPGMSNLIKSVGGGDAHLNAAYLSAIFVLLPVFLMAFAVTQVNGWSSDEEEGRLDLVLANPQTRLVVVLGRFAALASGAVVIALVTLLATAVAASATGLRLDSGNLAAAILGMIPLSLLVAAIGYLAAGWLRTAADTGLLSFLLLAWFFVSFVGPELHWPDATLRLSAFYYYGTPLLHGLKVTSMVGVVAVTALTLALGVRRFTQKDIGV